MTVLQTWDEPRPVKLTIADFLCLNDAGAFDGYAKTELIDGTVVAMNSQFSTHARVQSRFFRRLAEAVESALPGFEAWVEVSTAIPPVDMPEPDIVVTSFQATGRAPVPVGTIALVVEIADTTLSYDLGTKARLYAASGVPEYWLVDVGGEVVHQLWRPDRGTYTELRITPFGATLRAATADLEIGTAGL